MSKRVSVQAYTNWKLEDHDRKVAIFFNPAASLNPSSGGLSPLQVVQASPTIGPYIDPMLDIQCHAMEAILQSDGAFQLQVPRSDMEHNNGLAVLSEQSKQHRQDLISQQELEEFQTWVLEVIAEASTNYPIGSSLLTETPKVPPIEMKGDEESEDFIPLMWDSLDLNHFPPCYPQRRPILIPNSLYDPRYQAIGLPTDPFLRMFVLRRGFYAPYCPFFVC